MSARRSILMVFNPTSGRGRGRRTAEAVTDHLWGSGASVTIRPTKQRGDARQFVLEAMTLTGVGGLLGVLFGSAIAIFVDGLPIGLPATLTPLWVVIGFVSSTSIGLFFGIYPAWKAAQLDPVVALRYE